jgi:hypothetical protein
VNIGGALTSGMSTPSYLQSVLTRYVEITPDKYPDELKTAIAEAGKLASMRDQFAKDNKDGLVKVRSACLVILTFGGAAASEVVERGSIMNTFSSEYVRSARMRCLSHYGMGGSVAVTGGSAAMTTGQGGTTPMQATNQPMSGGTTTPRSSAPDKRDLETDISWALFYDLVAYYRFYEKLFGVRYTEAIVIAPIDISFVLLVIICGALGAMLRVTAEIYNPKLFGKEPNERRISLMYYFILGIMCSLIVYILAKTAFAGISDASYGSKSGNISPFVTAFLAVVSGAICEEAFQAIINAGRKMLNRMGGKQDEDGEASKRKKAPEPKSSPVEAKG